MRLLIVTGGTGGHIYPALALAKALQEYDQQAEILFIGNDDRMEATIVPEAGYAFQSLHTSGFRGNPLKKMKALTQMMCAYRKARNMIKKFQPDIVIGFGGYVSAPVILAAKNQHIPCMIHEQNSIMGAANRMIAPYVQAIVVCYQRLLKGKYKEKMRLLGNPRATSAMQTTFDASYFASLGLDKKKPLILVVMGSLGSTSMNDILCEALPKINQEYQILFVTGKNNFDDVKRKIKQQDNIKIVDYVNQLAIMDQVDCIICRAGATTLAEITALQVPSILVPSPYVAHNHQYYNASVLANEQAAVMIEENDFNESILQEKIAFIMEDELRKEHMRKKAKSLGFPNASFDMIQWMEELLKES